MKEIEDSSQHLKQNRIVPIEKLIPHPDNYRMHPEVQVRNLMASLGRFGQGRSIVIQDGPQGYLIVAGHGIVEAAKKLNYSELRADILPADWTPEQVRGYLVADNAHVEQAEDDQEVLARLLQEQKDAGFDLATLGTDEESLDQLLADLGDALIAEGEDSSEEDDEPAEAKPRATLADRFIVPPFSVLDARQGYWQDRKRAWIALGIQSELGRGEYALDDGSDEEYNSRKGGLTYGNSPEVTEAGLNYYRRQERIRKSGLLGFPEELRNHYKKETSLGAIPKNQEGIQRRTGKYTKGLARTFGQDLMRGEHVVGTGSQPDVKEKFANGLLGKHFPTIHGYDSGPAGGTVSQSGTSIFDPVLCELVYRWFTPANGAILDPFAGGSVRGIVAAKLGRSYTGIDLRREQAAANEEQWAKIAHTPFTLSGGQFQPTGVEGACVEAPDAILDLTPVEEHGGYLVKRDDLYCIAGVRGGKVRTCWRLSQGAPGLVTAGSRQSPQVNIVAHIARRLGIPCRVHTPEGELSPEVIAAEDAGAKVVQHPAGYNTVIIARAREDAASLGWVEIPFGMECKEAVEETSKQVASLDLFDIKRIVMPVGSGMSLAGVLHGLKRGGLDIPVLGVCVGADPAKRLDQYAPKGWREMVTLVDPGIDYHKPAKVSRLGDLELDPIYEAKCLPYLEKGDLLWVVGVRQTVADAAPQPVEKSAPVHVAADMLRFYTITPEDIKLWKRYYSAFEQTHSAPRHYQSPLRLLEGGKDMCWALVDNCLVILKRRVMMGNRVCYLLLPPMHIEGNAGVERQVLEAYRALGIGARLSDEDLARYGYSVGQDAEPDADNVEYLYRAGDLVELQGSQWREMRKVASKLDGAIDKGSLKLQVHRAGDDGTLDPSIRHGCHFITDSWKQEKREKNETFGRAHTCLERFVTMGKPLSATILQYLSTAEGTPVAYTIGEQIGPCWASLTTGFHDYDQQEALFSDASRALHLIDCRLWAERLGPDAILNMGAAPKKLSAGLHQTKEKLHPVATLPIYKLGGDGRCSEETWNATEPKPFQHVGEPDVSVAAPRWIVGDSRNLDELCPDTEVDFVFTCPPYYDLEVYSENPADLSTAGTYEEFLADYRAIMKAAIARLKPDRFACVVVGDIRDKRTGFYRNFISDTISACQDAGARLYNEAILVTVGGSLPIRVGRQFSSGRKLGKTHQNVLIFCKGDPAKAVAACGPITVEVPEEEEDEQQQEEQGEE